MSGSVTDSSVVGPYAEAVRRLAAVLDSPPPGVSAQGAEQAQDSLQQAAVVFEHAEDLAPGDPSMPSLIGNAQLVLGLADGELTNLGLDTCAAVAQALQTG